MTNIDVNIEASINSISTNKIEYEVFINGYVGLHFEKDFLIDFGRDFITKVELIPLDEVKEEPCKLRINFYLKQSVQKNTVPSEVDELLNIILDNLSFEYGISIKNVRRLNGMYLSVNAVATRGFTEAQINKMEMEISKSKTEPYKRLYRAALQNTDSVARFMFLYSILFEVLEAQSQYDVDVFIKRKCKTEYKSVENRRGTKILEDGKTPRMETIYTWLRNQVGHTQTNSQIAEVRMDIERKLNEFSTIVKKAIRQQGVAK